jgi:C4-type Zn-finger protein
MQPRTAQFGEIVTAYESQEKTHQWFIEEEHACPLCGTTLDLHHEIDPMDLKISEQARCPSCKITTKTKTSSLQ